MRAATIAASAFMVTVMLAGCIGDGRTEWAYDITQIDAANGMGRDGAGVRIGILDTGIDIGHPSLDHLADGDLSDGEMLDFRDYIRDRFGVDAAEDSDGHGSHVIGIMAARGSGFWDKLFRGGVDLKGAAPAASYYVARVCDDDGCPLSAIERALRWMRQQDVDVVSMSLGGARGAITLNDQIRDEIEALLDAGTVIVAAAGNDGPEAPDVDQPADIPGVIAVGAINEDGQVWSGSSHGSNDGANACRLTPVGTIGRCDPDRKPELVAPGVNILSSFNGGRYSYATGTSQAAPFVAATVALMLQGQPDLQDRDDVEQIKEILVDTARPVQGQDLPHDDAAGYGIIQARAAILAYGGA